MLVIRARMLVIALPIKGPSRAIILSSRVSRLAVTLSLTAATKSRRRETPQTPVSLDLSLGQVTLVSSVPLSISQSLVVSFPVAVARWCKNADLFFFH